MYLTDLRVLVFAYTNHIGGLAMIHEPITVCKNSYERLKVLSIDEVFEAIKNRAVFTFNNRECSPLGVRVMTYYTHGVACVWEGCKCVGKFFAVERQVNRKTAKPMTQAYHLNFYGFNEDGHEVMMTSDHKIPKSVVGAKGGIENRQPMCGPHNQRKGNSLIYT
jgi:hypothetical protein